MGAVAGEERRETEKAVGRAGWAGAQGRPPRRGWVSQEAGCGRLEGGRHTRPVQGPGTTEGLVMERAGSGDPG